MTFVLQDDPTPTPEPQPGGWLPWTIVGVLAMLLAAADPKTPDNPDNPDEPLSELVRKFDAAVPDNTVAEGYGMVYMSLADRLEDDTTLYRRGHVADLIAYGGPVAKAAYGNVTTTVSVPTAEVMAQFGDHDGELTTGDRLLAAELFRTIGTALVESSKI